MDKYDAMDEGLKDTYIPRIDASIHHEREKENVLIDLLENTNEFNVSQRMGR